MDVFDIFFPKKCLECGRFGKYICNNCFSKTEQAFAICPGCGNPSRDGLRHSYCKYKTPLNRLILIWKYSGVVRKALIGLKFKLAFSIAEELANRAVTQLQTIQLADSLLVPIPLHPRRQNWRGFNQAEEIGKIIASKMNWVFEPKLLKRIIDTPHQIGLNKKQRLENISEAFVLKHKDPSLITRNPSLILFDDVYTTGSTMKEAAKVLKKAGFDNIVGLAVAS
ncbi:hypothetical protein A2873_02515 [Candidatus Woesebacteria bacterium RIFCSPHIGHO2_01_FULL_42_80]|nr:MAG: hypothetical protein A2873_02515 [Candidatus Woesebacteria bacterium RIFCSPHIGHO2_01_FULL_42_80]OGM67742.1 MAG: hypothetical protein A2969_02305 [Candidatus Woesebacteria bacterium RIFCSPLOWO2_01_FULL_42_67]OGM70710.1 MAG: hypothetical protein A3I55_03050 [Candidatus Woesebacteria bacterium RIFCSPLOWO2_02_FULL_42_10]